MKLAKNPPPPAGYRLEEARHVPRGARTPQVTSRVGPDTGRGRARPPCRTGKNLPPCRAHPLRQADSTRPSDTSATNVSVKTRERPTARGFTTTGPFPSLNEMTYGDKKGCDLVIVPELDVAHGQALKGLAGWSGQPRVDPLILKTCRTRTVHRVTISKVYARITK